MISKQELADGIRFAGRRCAEVARHTKDWDRKLGHEWTTRDAFVHVAETGPGLQGFAPMIDSGMLSGLGAQQLAQMNAQTIAQAAGKSKDEIIQAMVDGYNASAAHVETMDEGDLAKVVKLGDYEMPKAEILAQIWIHHAIAHAYEASYRWPLG